MLTQIKSIEGSKAWAKNPAAAQVAPVLAEFRGRLLEALGQPPAVREESTTVPSDTPNMTESTNDRLESRPKSDSIRIYTLDRVAGEVAKQLVVHEQVDDVIDPEDIEYRVACRELTDDEPLTWVDAGLEGNAIRIFFPDDQYYGFPPFLDLEKPRRPQVGQTWRLRRPDGAPAATFVLKSMENAERRRPEWKHGDIVRALYDGKAHVARFIRTTESGLALVHWEVDDTFSPIPTEHVMAATRKQRWSRELEPEDVEIEY